MFTPPFSRDSLVADDLNPLTQAYRDVVIYDEATTDDPLYEGPIVVHPNGWIELEGHRLLSPSAIHHIDIYDELDDGGSEDGRDERTGDGRRSDRFGH
ncbi:hypothetical protein [Natronoglomus mannanivorans]|uniref:Uncharacterized protein n=1 Tax=Natronoglomus mannanivorans TaxID=2979990 RepID=A0AAP2YYF3_9EURY|nr:hypothetical protein [Halobacteria archaeon AArc-xg1-1]